MQPIGYLARRWNFMFDSELLLRVVLKFILNLITDFWNKMKKKFKWIISFQVFNCHLISTRNARRHRAISFFLSVGTVQSDALQGGEMSPLNTIFFLFGVSTSTAYLWHSLHLAFTSLLQTAHTRRQPLLFVAVFKIRNFQEIALCQALLSKG